METIISFIMLGLGIILTFLQNWCKTGCFYGQICIEHDSIEILTSDDVWYHWSSKIQIVQHNSFQKKVMVNLPNPNNIQKLVHVMGELCVILNPWAFNIYLMILQSKLKFQSSFRKFCF